MRRPSTEPRSARPGRRSSAATRLPTASMSPRSTAWATRPLTPTLSRREREKTPPTPLPPGEGEEKPEDGGAGIEFWGSSFVADPQGVIVAEASPDREEVLVAAIDPERIEDVCRNWPFLRDRRIDAYSGITRRFLDEDPSGKRRDGS